jgi:hypothetical protein
MSMEQDLLTTSPATWKVAQAIVFDWYDGPREGLCRLASPAVEFRFRLLDERPTADAPDDRLLRLDELPAGSIERALSALEDLGKPQAPIWTPIWKFSSVQARQRAEAFLAQTEQQARPTSIVIHTRDLSEFLGCWNVAGMAANGESWFSTLKIAPKQTA